MSARTAIIVLNWNSHQMTADCIRSLVAMDASDSEIVVVDNGSSDGSEQHLRREFPQITLFRQHRNLGFAGGCNVGIRYALARGVEYVLLLNNDTYVAPDFLHEMLSRIEESDQIAAVCPKIYFADHPNVLWYAGGDFSLWTGSPKHRGWRQVDHGQCDNNQAITQATGCAMLVRSVALRDVGLLDEQFWAYVEDLDWTLRFAEQGYRVVFAPKAHVWHRDGGTSVKLMGSGSQSIRQFFSTRNMVFVARKHLRWWQIPTFIIGFMVNHLVFYTGLRLWRRDFPALLAIYRGLGEGCRTSLGVSQHATTFPGEQIPGNEPIDNADRG